MNSVVFWDVVLYSLVDIGQHFRGAYCLHHQVITHTILWGATSQRTAIFILITMKSQKSQQDPLIFGHIPWLEIMLIANLQ
jgi:membrane-associated PAP2 superfamily phosphatase